MKSRSDAILRVIATLKLLKGALFLAVAFGALTLVRRDVAHGVRGWIDQLQPSSHYMREMIARIEAANPHTLEMVAVATFIYACVFVTEGVGLMMKKVWAEYLTTAITISFIPVELYEMIDRASVTKLAVILFNIAIVIYLVWLLRRGRHWPFRDRTTRSR